jgi:phage-related protein
MPALQHFAVFMSGPGQQGIATFGDHAKAMGGTLMDLGTRFLSSKEFGEVMTAAVETFKPIFADASKAVKQFMTDHKATFDDIWNTTKQIMGEIGPLILAVLGAIKQFWHDHGTQVIAIVSGFFNVIIGVIDGVMHLIADIIQLVTDIIKGNWHAVWADVVKIIQDAVMTILNLAVNLMSLWKQTMNFIESEAIELGKGIISGIVTAIEDGAGAIWNALKNAVGGAMGSLKHLLGISSPSTVFAKEVGEPIAQGIGVGIANAAGSATGALGNLMGGLTGTGANASSLAGIGAGGGAIIFDFRGSQMMSDRDMETLAGKLLPALGRLAVGSGINFRV